MCLVRLSSCRLCGSCSYFHTSHTHLLVVLTNMPDIRMFRAGYVCLWCEALGSVLSTTNKINKKEGWVGRIDEEEGRKVVCNCRLQICLNSSSSVEAVSSQGDLAMSAGIFHSCDLEELNWIGSKRGGYLGLSTIKNSQPSSNCAEHGEVRFVQTYSPLVLLQFP